MNSKELTTAISEYLDDNESYYAIMVDGAWGSGKTYYIEEENSKFKKLLKEKELSNLRVSLFGLQSSSELYSRILEKTINNDTHGVNAAIRKMGKDLGLNLLSKRLGFDINFNPETMLPLFLKKKILILDDLERCSISSTDMLGIINDFVENQKIKVIILCDESKLLNVSQEERLAETTQSESKENPNISKNSEGDNLSYVDLKEKVVWRTYSYSAAIVEVSEQLLEDAFRGFADLNWKESLKCGITQAKCENFRSVLKLKLLIAYLAGTEFFNTTNHDACQREDVLIDIIHVSLKYVSGYKFDDEIDINLNQRPFNELELALVSYGSRNKKSHARASELFKRLSFIGSYFCGQRNLKEVDKCLNQYCKVSYPLGERSREVSNMINNARMFEMENEEALEFVAGIVEAAKNGEVPFDLMEEAICLVDMIENTGICERQEPANELVGAFSSWVDDNADLFTGRKQQYYGSRLMYKSNEKVSIFRETIDRVCAGNSVRDLTVSLLDGTLSSSNSVSYYFSVHDVSSIDIDSVIQAIERYDIKELHKFQTDLKWMFNNAVQNDSNEIDEYKGWLTEFRNRVEQAGVQFGMRSHRRDCILEYVIIPEIERFDTVPPTSKSA